MKVKKLLCLLIILKSIPIYAFQRDTVKIFYNINQKELSVSNKSKLDSLSKFFNDTTAIHVLGYADYLGKRTYNDSLSKQRAEIVKNYLLKLHSKNVLMVAEGKGEESSQPGNVSAMGEPLNRRVDIIFAAAAVKNKIAIAPLKEPAVQKKKDDSVYTKINNISNLDVGESLSFSELTFQPGRHFLNPEAMPYLFALTAYLKQHENIKIEIQGHICCDYNLTDGYDPDARQNNLSVNRAKFVYDYLVSKGIKAERMQYKGLGSTQPKVYPELTTADQVKNRRVQIVLLGK